MTNKCKRIKKNTKHFFVISGREDLYFREEVAASFKPHNRTYPCLHAARHAPAPPSLPPLATIASTTPIPSSSPPLHLKISSNLKTTTASGSQRHSLKLRIS